MFSCKHFLFAFELLKMGLISQHSITPVDIIINLCFCLSDSIYLWGVYVGVWLSVVFICWMQLIFVYGFQWSNENKVLTSKLMAVAGSCTPPYPHPKFRATWFSLVINNLLTASNWVFEVLLPDRILWWIM